MNTDSAYLNLPWLHLRCGHFVYAGDDFRHVGEIIAIHNSATAKVRWLENNWLSEELLHELHRVNV